MLPQNLVSVETLDKPAWAILNAAAITAKTITLAEHFKINAYAIINTVFSTNKL